MAVIPPSARTYSKFQAIQDSFQYSRKTQVLQYEITTLSFTRMTKCTKALETYLESLQRQGEPTTSKAESGEGMKVVEANKGLQSLERYISILKEDAKPEEFLPSTTGRNRPRISEDSAVGYMNVAKEKTVYARKSNSSSLFDVKADGSNLYLTSILISMNIAVFLFEIASPIKNADGNLWSLPLMYGAKVNDLIMVGEWWRLVTPMFLHAGLLHIALDSWVLLSFGPQVCKGYGAFTFFLIYVLGGISGNFTSFLHTSEPTVGGSGPVFAVIGSWLIYQAQNKDVYGKENTDSMFQKAVIATASSFVLANFGPIDNWTSLGAAISGIIYGYLTSQVIRIDDASSPSVENRIKEEMTLSKQTINPWKSLIIFTLFVSVFSSLLLFVESPPLSTLELKEITQIVN
ncbi:hypothetical protein vseg_002353 [Gypsophila vaccaria]